MVQIYLGPYDFVIQRNTEDHYYLANTRLEGCFEITKARFHLCNDKLIMPIY